MYYTKYKREPITDAQTAKIYLLLRDSDNNVVKHIYQQLDTDEYKRGSKLSDILNNAKLTKNQASYFIQLLYGSDGSISNYKDKLYKFCKQINLIK
jgi:hypothetical protein